MGTFNSQKMCQNNWNPREDIKYKQKKKKLNTYENNIKGQELNFIMNCSVTN